MPARAEGKAPRMRRRDHGHAVGVGLLPVMGRRSMNRRRFLRFLCLAPATAAVTPLLAPSPAAAWTQCAQAFEVYRRQNEQVMRERWTIEWFEHDFQATREMAYAVRATHKVTGEVRARGWRAATPRTLVAKSRQRAEVKALMRAWATKHLA